MGNLREKLRRFRPGSSKLPASEPVNSAVTSQTSNAEEATNDIPFPPTDQPSPSVATETSTPDTIRIQSLVWNEAYDSLKKEAPGTVDAYERILSGQLSNDVVAINVRGYPENAMGNAADRREKLTKLIETGQSKTEKAANAKEKINTTVQQFNQLRGVISLAVKADPTASTAWAGVTAVLDIFTSPLEESAANREGIKYILERAQWYWDLSKLVLDADKIESSHLELQKSLRKSIVKLYKKLLLYQMESVCLYSRSEVAIILRDMVKLDDWKGKIESIEKEALRVKEDIKQFRDEDTSIRLRNLDVSLQGVRTDLQTIASAIRDESSQQLKLREEEKDKAFMNQLHIVDPRSDKRDIERLKGGLVEKAHDLVYESSGFGKLQQDDSKGTLWITGNPGSGKTMFLCGIIDRLVKRPELGVVSYFFCRADRLQNRTANAVMRGLLRCICTQTWGVTRYLRERCEDENISLAQANDTVESGELQRVLGMALNAASMSRAVLIVDAIDECDKDNIKLLLRIIGELSHKHPAKWILSTRTSEIYSGFLRLDAPAIEVSYLELSKAVISRAVQEFVTHSVKKLSEINGYPDDVEKDVDRKLRAKAGDTFLWVALVCLELQSLDRGTRHVINTIEEIPQDLTKLYEGMLSRATESKDGPECRQILRLVCIAYRPLTLDELRSFVPRLKEIPLDDARGVVANCGSFLSLQGYENDLEMATIVHESAREYLIEMTRKEASLDGIIQQHRLVLRKALSNVKELRRNIYDLPSLGTAIEEVKKPDPDPFLELYYSCHHWLDHANHILEEQEWGTSDTGVLDDFIRHDLLHWIEMLSLTKNMAKSTAAFQRFSNRYTETCSPDSPHAAKLVEEARRFLLYNKSSIEYAPLQVYASALLFCPQQSMGQIKSLYQHQLKGMTAYPESDGATFSQLTQVLPLSSRPDRMAFSPDGNFLATGNSMKRSRTDPHEYILKIWDILASHCIVSVQVGDRICGLTFSNDGTQVLVALMNGTVIRFATPAGTSSSSISYPSRIWRAEFSPNKKVIALKVLAPETWEPSLILLDCETGDVVCPISKVSQFSFSQDSLQVAVLSNGNREISLWSIEDHPIFRLMISLETVAEEITFFSCDKVAVRSTNFISIFLTTDGSKTLNLPCNSTANSMAWLGIGLSYLCHCKDNTIRVYDDSGMNCAQTFPAIHIRRFNEDSASTTYAFASTSNLLALAGDKGVRVWNLNMQEDAASQSQHSPETWQHSMPNMAFSPNEKNSSLLAFASLRGVEIRTLQHGEVKNISTLPTQYLDCPAFTPNGKAVAYPSRGSLQVWNISNGTVSPERKFSTIFDLSFSHDGASLAVAAGTDGVFLWNLTTHEIKHIISEYAWRVVYTHNDQLLAVVGLHSVHVWSVSPVQSIQRLHSYQLPADFGIKAFVNFSPNDESLGIVIFKIVAFSTSYEAVHLWHLGESRPQYVLPWPTEKRYMNRWESLAVSPDGNLIAVALDHCLWVWDLRLPVTSEPLVIELSYKTRKCCFDVESVRLLVDGGVILINLNLRQLEYRGYGLSEDCAWITKNNQELLYLTQDFRPRRSSEYFISDSVAFLGSAVAIQNESRHIQILRFDNDSDSLDSRWAD